MSASIWTPGSNNIPVANPNSQITREDFTATAGQTDFTLSSFTYNLGSNALAVYVQGVKQSGDIIQELSTSSFRIVGGVEEGDYVEVIGNTEAVDAEGAAVAAAASAAAALLSEQAAAASAAAALVSETNMAAGIITGDLNLTGLGKRIKGDFSNAPLANRVLFQTSTVDGNTAVGIIPNGTGTAGSVQGYSKSDPTNASRFTLVVIDGVDVRLDSGIAGTGTYLPMTFHTGGSERMRIDTNGNAGVGATPVDGRGVLQVVRAISGGAPQSSGSTDANQFATFGNSNVSLRSGIYAAGPVWFQVSSATSYNINYDLSLQPNGGNTLHVGPNGGLGYGTGAGGTVTQATSKSTTVTLNKPCGQITMNNAALAAGASVTFLLNNSLVATADTLVVNALFTGGNYTADVVDKGVGSAFIRVTNTSAGSLSDAVLINFALIKGATS